MLIGREKEIRELRQAYDSEESKSVAIFGRRRIGKTYLVREVFHDKFAFSYSGMAKATTKEQLQRFYLSLKDHGYKSSVKPSNWIEAFYMLEQFLKDLPAGKKVVFLDELPWMDAPKSSFMPAFENFWNGWASARKDILLIVCGSATSWMVKKILKNRGGLHNRLNNQIHLQPFNLHECELYAKSINLPMERQEIMEAYMILGGIPFYWSLLNKSLSLSQNIDVLFFGKTPKLGNEFNELYSSLFKQPEPYLDIITALAKKKIGMTRDEIIENANIATSGLLTKYLEDLENCGFIRKYKAIGHGVSCGSRFRQNFKKQSGWCAFNSGMPLAGDGNRVAIALDHSFISKSGKKTPGLGRYWSGCAGMTKRGLGILGFAQVAAGVSDARFLFAVQTMPLSTRGRTPFYLEHMKDNRGNQTAKCLRAVSGHREQLPGISSILVGDCLFASYNFVTGAIRLGFNVVSRLRDDAVLHYLHTGPRKSGRGRPKELDGTVDIHDLREYVFVRDTVTIDGGEVALFSAMVKGKSLRRKIKVVIAELKCGDRVIRKILFSTDPDMETSGVFLIYHSRFQGQNSDSSKNNYVLTDEIPDNLLFFGVRDSA